MTKDELKQWEEYGTLPEGYLDVFCVVAGEVHAALAAFPAWCEANGFDGFPDTAQMLGKKVTPEAWALRDSYNRAWAIAVADGISNYDNGVYGPPVEYIHEHPESPFFEYCYLIAPDNLRDALAAEEYAIQAANKRSRQSRSPGNKVSGNVPSPEQMLAVINPIMMGAVALGKEDDPAWLRAKILDAFYEWRLADREGREWSETKPKFESIRRAYTKATGVTWSALKKSCKEAHRAS